MRLNDPLVTSFLYESEEYSIDLAFDNVLDVFDVLGDETLRDYEKAEICLSLLLDESIQKKEAVELWNYVYESFIHIESKRPIEYDRKGNPLPVQKEHKPFIDLDKDAEYIFASFQQAYKMNLYQEQGNLHWREFQALLNGLPSDTIMQRIVQIRAWEPSKGDSAEYKKAMHHLQDIYALDDEEQEEVD
ncbi:Gp15 family bacteriophage protein [Lederbergia lenta]|uniref:Gp15 family bacteriophage protein n=1 Tax=Lederbergia lenta TaxID=1467 RepID=UPI00203F207A|nr:Gp15 family bacteriophage protein [Lederbergia lenta]MCM3110686.1 bacteriophage Gp15 family protein [Lederbergia lenta]